MVAADLVHRRVEQGGVALESLQLRGPGGCGSGWGGSRLGNRAGWRLRGARLKALRVLQSFRAWAVGGGGQRESACEGKAHEVWKPRRLTVPELGATAVLGPGRGVRQAGKDLLISVHECLAPAAISRVMNRKKWNIAEQQARAAGQREGQGQHTWAGLSSSVMTPCWAERGVKSQGYSGAVRSAGLSLAAPGASRSMQAERRGQKETGA